MRIRLKNSGAWKTKSRKAGQESKKKKEDWFV